MFWKYDIASQGFKVRAFIALLSSTENFLHSDLKDFGKAFLQGSIFFNFFQHIVRIH